MPRRRQDEKGAFIEFAEAFEQLPLKAGLITAAVLALAGVLVRPVFAGQAGVAGSLAVAGQYLCWGLAFLVLVSALVGAVRRLGDRDRFDSNVRIADLTWKQFEGYLAEYFRRHGAAVTYRGGSSPDGGVDLVVDDTSGRRIVQAKHWKARSVGVVPLRALWGVLSDERADGAVCVTSGTFTPDAIEFARGKRFELINGEQLARLVAEVKSTPALAASAPTTKGTPTVTAAAAAAPPTANPKSQAGMACPQCGRGVLQRKLARRGANAGAFFLSCSLFPECKYARNL